MPALRSGQHLSTKSANGGQTNSNSGKASNGLYSNSILASSSDDKMMRSQAREEEEAEASYQLKKKLILLEEEKENNTAQRKINKSDSNNNNQDDDTFADTYTLSSAKHQDEAIGVFGRQEVASSIGQSAKDQFAVALLRLQADLDATSRRLADIEGKLEQSVQQQQRQATSKKSREEAAAAKGPAFNKSNVANILYLTWPVLVFFAMRAFEKRSLSAKLA